MRSAYDGAVRAGQGGAAAIAAACTVLLARASGLTPLQIGEALGIVAVAAEAAEAGEEARPSPDTAAGQRRSGLQEADASDLVAALAYALRHDERGRPRKGGWDFAAELAAEHLAGHVRRCFVVTPRRPGRPHRAG